ncbi:hypothetical protein Tco_1032828 [Tanacetum coccineum]|uniref:Retrovirus-related Pol polyprotein from transposon TNT 1-94-like beta-barrel domain-containing protein n=1 Tax=Tanacetum coccineum TaxID=301880 RepID=A0ABQ5GF01_9ASTR
MSPLSTTSSSSSVAASPRSSSPPILSALLGANLIPDRSYIPYKDRRLSISKEALGAFRKSQTYRDKEVNMARDSDNALVCCVENTVEDRIMDSDASFHATYCKQELERFKLRSGKVRLADYKTLDIAAVGDVILKTSFGTSWTLKDVRIGISMLASKGNVSDVQKVDMDLSFIMSMKTRKLQSRSCDSAENVPKTPLQFGAAKRLSRTFRAESTEIHVEAPKMLWSDSVSTAYLVYRIPYVLIGLRIPEEEWQGKNTSLAHLKVFGCDSFIKVKDICREAMKCTIIGSGSNEMRYRFQDTKSHQSPSGSSDTSEGSENSGSFKDSGRSDEEYSEDRASSNEGGFETPQVRRSTRESRAPNKAIIEEMVSLKKNQTWSLVKISARKKASQRLWMFRVKEKQDGIKRYTKSSIHLVKNLKNEEPCRDVHQVGDEREVKALSSLNLPLRLLMNGGSREIIPSLMMLVQDTLYRKSPSPVFGWCSMFRMFGSTERLE